MPGRSNNLTPSCYTTDPQGSTRTARTASFGYYRFDDVEAGQTYVVGVASKRYVFIPRTISVADELTDFDLVAESGQNRLR